MKINFNIKKLDKDAILPTKAYPGDLGYDLYANEDVNFFNMHDRFAIKTGISVQFPNGYGGFIKDRSSIANKGLITTGGVIDNQYIGEIRIIMTNNSNGFHKIKKGDKIAQLVPIPVTDWNVNEVSEFEIESERGDKGFGSSDKKE